MRRPVHFEIHADDPARARKFYETLFGGIGWVAYAFDPEGNIFGMIQNKPV